MSKNEVISENGIILLLTNLLSVKAIFAFPRNLFVTSGNAAWIEVIFVSLFAFSVLELSFLTYSRCGKKSVVELSENIGGSGLKIAVSLMTAAILAVNLITETRIFSESVKIILLPKTETEYILILFATAVCIGQRCSLKRLADINAIFFPVCIVFLLLIVISLYKNYEINSLCPVFGRGIKSIAYGGLKDISAMSDILAVNLIIPHCKDISVPKKCGRKALIISSLILFLICLGYGLCYPYPQTAKYLLPVYQLTKRIRAGEYFQRFEALFEFVWEISQLLFSAIYLFLICEVLGKAFDLKDTKMISYGTAAFVTLLAAEPVAIAEFLEISHKIELVAAIFAYSIPIAIPSIFILKGRCRS